MGFTSYRSDFMCSSTKLGLLNCPTNKESESYPERTWWSTSGQLSLLVQKVEGLLSTGVVLGDLCLNDPGRRTGGAGTRHSRVLLRLCTRALAPGAGSTLGKPGVLLSPLLLRDPGVRPADPLSEVSARLNENLEKFRQKNMYCYLRSLKRG